MRVEVLALGAILFGVSPQPASEDPNKVQSAPFYEQLGGVKSPAKHQPGTVMVSKLNPTLANLGQKTAPPQDKDAKVSLPGKRVVQAEKAKPTITLIIDGKSVEFEETYWNSAEASWYGENDHSGGATAWTNGCVSRKAWNPVNCVWERCSNRTKFFTWTYKGVTWRDWYNFRKYKSIIPTVAHKEHQFGTFIKFRYKGHEEIAMVTDRGPFCGKRQWDLNPCLAHRLHFGGTGEVQYSLLRRK